MTKDILSRINDIREMLLTNHDLDEWSTAIVNINSLIKILENQQTSKVVKIIWDDVKSPPDDSCRYDHVRGLSPIGEFSISWKSWKTSPNYDIEHPQLGWIGYGRDLEDAKETAQDYFDSEILSCIVGDKG